jgi:hypothetical protein
MFYHSFATFFVARATGLQKNKLAGFAEVLDVEITGEQKNSNCLNRWNKTKKGESGFLRFSLRFSVFGAAAALAKHRLQRSRRSYQLWQAQSTLQTSAQA